MSPGQKWRGDQTLWQNLGLDQHHLWQRQHNFVFPRTASFYVAIANQPSEIDLHLRQALSLALAQSLSNQVGGVFTASKEQGHSAALASTRSTFRQYLLYPRVSQGEDNWTRWEELIIKAKQAPLGRDHVIVDVQVVNSATAEVIDLWHLTADSGALTARNDTPLQLFKSMLQEISQKIFI